nr:glycoside hydrolase family 130 protein [uncultured Friedmanniella sp.]
MVRSPLVLRSDPGRVIVRPFLPGQELLADGRSRVDAVVDRVLAMAPSDVAATLADTLAIFADRHDDLHAVFAKHYALVAAAVETGEVSEDQALLIGSYVTQEYALEAAALFNPSMVTHPDQDGLADGELRFLMSVRSVGEGHISSIQLRTGVLGASGTELRIDPPGPPQLPEHRPASLPRAVLLAALAERTDARADQLNGLVPERVDPDNLDQVLATVRHEYFDPTRGVATSEQLRWVYSCDYGADVPAGRPIANTVLFPAAPDERNGMEDARLTRLVEDDGRVGYHATYTAYDGSHIASHLISTADFRQFEVRQLLGPASKSKGMALFPRRVGGDYTALVRWDRESIAVARSRDLRWWNRAVTVQQPHAAWELIQLGNCGPPVETEAGWLVLNHGVGPVRRYGIGAILLDLDDPTVLRGVLPEPLLLPNEDERIGYVPNVVYSCGALRHGNTLVLPYGCSDSSIRFAFVDLPALLDRLTTSRP